MNITAQDLDRLLLAGENITFEVKTATNGVPKKFLGNIFCICKYKRRNNCTRDYRFTRI